jgi:hypothetical protein
VKKKRPSPKQFEARLIQLLRRLFEKLNLRVKDHLKVGELPLEIDVVVVSPKPNWIPDAAKFPKLFDHFRRHNVLEVKTEHDRFEVNDLPKLLAYGWHYMAKFGLEEVRDVTLTALVHHLTPKVQKALPKFGFVEVMPNIFRRDADMVAHVIAFGNLPDEMLPEELQAFTNRDRRRQLLLSSLGNKKKSSIVETILDLFESEVKNIMLNIREKSLKNILSAVGDKKIVSTLGAKRVVSALGKEKFISALGEEKVISALGEEKIFSALGNKKIIASLMKNKQLLQALLAQLDAEQLRDVLAKKERN